MSFFTTNHCFLWDTITHDCNIIRELFIQSAMRYNIFLSIHQIIDSNCIIYNFQYDVSNELLFFSVIIYNRSNAMPESIIIRLSWKFFKNTISQKYILYWFCKIQILVRNHEKFFKKFALCHTSNCSQFFSKIQLFIQISIISLLFGWYEINNCSGSNHAEHKKFTAVAIPFCCIDFSWFNSPKLKCHNIVKYICFWRL